MKISICTTNYQCAHALEEHLRSVYSALEDIDFEYLVVDNHSTDGSWGILKRWEKGHDNFRCWQKRCTMGKGRQLAFERSKGNFIVVVDTDTLYEPWTGDFIRRCMTEYPDYAVQAIYCGVFPRSIWTEIGGRSDMNTAEDLDMWMRIHELGKMKWYPAYAGKNIKDSADSFDYLSGRYKTKRERVTRLIRSEYNRWKIRRWLRMDLTKVWKENTVDMGFAPLQDRWFGERKLPPTPKHIYHTLRAAGRIILRG